ncbi:MAG: hypothetical protein AAFO72_02570 [Pseudomonadota bacterium]
MSSPTQTSVRKRRVFYIPGYDPIHPRRYRELYRKEAAEQGRVSGYEIELKAKSANASENGRYGWTVTGAIDGQETVSDFEVLVWSDIVRDSMDTGILGTYAALAKTGWVYIASGALFRLMRLRKGPVIAALYPVGFLLLQLVLALLLARWVGLAMALIHPWLTWSGLILVPFVLEWFRRKDNKFFAYYLMHDYAYSARHRGSEPPELEARMAEFTDAIARAMSEDVDEVLVVGHSSGAHIAVSVLSDMLRAGHVKDDAPELSFLSLGQVVPMVSFLPDAHRLRRDLSDLSARDELTWVDVTAPGDGCAFALCDPVQVSGVAPARQRWPLILSAAFTQTLSPARWKELRWRFFRLHFQYLCAFDRPGDYDYFRITAGPNTLRAHFADRAPSPSRIVTPVNRFTECAP